MTRDLPALKGGGGADMLPSCYHFTVFNLKTYFFDCLQRTANVGSFQVFQCEDSSTRRQSAMLSSWVLRLPRCTVDGLGTWEAEIRPSNHCFREFYDSRAICPRLTQAFCIVLFSNLNTWIWSDVGDSTYGRDFLKSSHTLLKSKVAWFKKLPWQCQWFSMFPIFPSFCHVNVLYISYHFLGIPIIIAS